MLKLRQDTKIYVANHPIDGRKAIDGLAAFIADSYSDELKAGSVYVFYNKYKTQVKCLVWDKNGFVLHQKRLERGRFKITAHQQEGCRALSTNQLDWLLAGLDFELMNQFSELDYSQYY